MSVKVDPTEAMVRNYSYGRWAHPSRSLPLGVNQDPRDGHLYFRRTDPGLATITMAPPQSTKTTGVLAPQILTHHGPRVVMSAKTDLARLTAVACSRLGPVFHLDATGKDPVEGLIPAHLSVTVESSSPSEARNVASMIATCGNAPGRDAKNEFWSQLGAELMAPALYAAHRLDYDEEFVLRVVRGSASAEDEMVDYLEKDPAGADLLDSYNSLRRTHAEGLSSIRMSAMHSLRIYSRPEVRDYRGKMPFDFYNFVRGWPKSSNRLKSEGDDHDRAMEAQGIYPTELTGSYATVFITATSTQTEEAQLIYRLFLRMLWTATSDLHREDQRNDVTYRRPTLLVMDELANIAPDPIYPSLVSQSGDQGLIVSSAIQDLGQLEKHFGTEAKAFLTLHGHRLIFPGISNPETLRAISDMLGTRWEGRTTMSDNVTQSEHPSTGYGYSQSDHLIPILNPGEIRNGKPGDPKAVLHLDNHPGFEYLWPSPVWAARPWPRMLIASLHVQSNSWMVDPGDGEWPVVNMPVPDLGRFAPGARDPILVQSHGVEEGRVLYSCFLDAKRIYAERRDVA